MGLKQQAEKFKLKLYELCCILFEIVNVHFEKGYLLDDLGQDTLNSTKYLANEIITKRILSY